jgi:hypothetical protein
MNFESLISIGSGLDVNECRHIANALTLAASNPYTQMFKVNK